MGKTLRTYRQSCSRSRFAGMAALCIAAFAGSESASAHITDTQATDSVAVSLFFRQSSRVIEPEFRGNADSINRIYTTLLSKDSARVIAVDIRSSASPEGNADFNRHLSDDRAEAASSVLTNLPGFEPQMVSINSVGEDWIGLINAITTCKSTTSTPPIS